MKLSRERIRNGVMMAALVFLLGGIGAITSNAQEEGRTPPSESPKSETPPSPPAESPRSDPAPSSPSSPSSGGSSGSSSNNDSSNNSSSSRGSDSGSSGSSNDSSGGSSRSRSDEGRKAPKVDNDGNVRRSGDRNSGRERVLVDKMPVTPTSGSGGSDSGRGRDRDRDGDRDRDRWRGRRGHDRDRHRHRNDDCYLVPAYDDTVVYVPTTYPTKPVDSRTAYERGYDDGVFTGAHDGRRQQTYDPGRSHFYKDTPGYRSAMGSRDVYKQAYRDGFLRGYREGFQNWQKYFVGGEFRR